MTDAAPDGLPIRLTVAITRVAVSSTAMLVSANPTVVEPPESPMNTLAMLVSASTAPPVGLLSRTSARSTGSETPSTSNGTVMLRSLSSSSAHSNVPVDAVRSVELAEPGMTA